jgi:hypothetical protein
VLLIYQKTPFSIQDQNTLKSNIISFDHVNKKDISLVFVDTENQLADIFTKPLVKDRFNFIKEKLKIIKNPNNL